MLCQVVAPHEAFLTLAALKALVSCGREKNVLSNIFNARSIMKKQ